MKTETSKKNFKDALKALNFRENVLRAFFRRLTPLDGKTLNEKLIASIDGGVKKILDFESFAEAKVTAQALRRDRLKSQTRFMYLVLGHVWDDLEEGDLSLIISLPINRDQKTEEKLYQSLFDITSCSNEGYTYETYDYFGQLIRHWRNTLEIKRYEAYTKGQPTYSALSKEADLFISILENIHVIMGKRKRRLLKKRRLPPGTPTFIRG